MGGKLACFLVAAAGAASHAHKDSAMRYDIPAPCRASVAPYAECIAALLAAPRLTPRISPDGRWVILHERQMEQARSWLMRTHIGGPLQQLDRPVFWTGDNELFSAGSTLRPDEPGRAHGTLPGYPTSGTPVWSADGRFAIVGSNPTQSNIKEDSWLSGEVGRIYDETSDLRGQPRLLLPHGELGIYDRTTQSYSKFAFEHTKFAYPSLDDKGLKIAAEAIRLSARGEPPRTRIFTHERSSGNSAYLSAKHGDALRPVFSPSGLRLAFLINASGDLAYGAKPSDHPYALAVQQAAGSYRTVTQLPFAGSTTPKMHWTADESKVWFDFQEEFRPWRLFVDIATGRQKRVLRDPADHSYGESSFSADGKQEAFVADSPCRKSEVYLARLDGEGRRLSKRPLTRIWNQVPTFGVTCKAISWTSNDGTRVEGALLLPSGSKTKLPTIISLKGGPGPIEGRFGGELWGIELAMAANGYAVLIPYTRGRAGRTSTLALGIRTSCERFTPAIADVLSGISLLEKQKLVDTQRIGIVGHSYGGGLAMQIAVRQRSVAAVVNIDGGGQNLLDTGNLDSKWHKDSRKTLSRDFFGYCDSNISLDRLIGNSPLLQSDQITAPVLFMPAWSKSGDAALWQEAHYIYNVLKSRGIPTQLVEYRMIHSPTGEVQIADQIRRILKWMDRYVKQ